MRSYTIVNESSDKHLYSIMEQYCLRNIKAYSTSSEPNYIQIGRGFNVALFNSSAPVSIDFRSYNGYPMANKVFIRVAPSSTCIVTTDNVESMDTNEKTYIIPGTVTDIGISRD